MSIDRIGKGAGAAITSGTIPVDTAVDAVEPFRVNQAARTGATAAVSPIEQLRTGEIDVNRYLDLRVEQATAHLDGKLPGDQLSFIRESLRAQLETDPMLVELASRAAGSAFDKPSHGGR
jgi:hypothetical protein